MTGRDYKAMAEIVSPGVLSAMREWVADCDWGEAAADPDWLAFIHDWEILRGVDQHFDYGIGGFLESINSDLDGSAREPRGRVQ